MGQYSIVYYKKELADGSEFIFVNTIKATKETAFDHKKLAHALSKEFQRRINPYNLPFNQFNYKFDTVSDGYIESDFILNNDWSIKSGEFVSEPSKVSSTTSFGYKTLHKTISQIYPTALVAPYLVVGATDSRHFNAISDNIYRFSAIKLNKKNIK